MNLASHLIQRGLKLPPPLTRDVVVQRDLRVPMPDGVDLLADRWAPKKGGEGLPTALIRSPYGRSGPFGLMMARPLAERGYQVLIQSTRGGFGSGGAFNPMVHDREDGLSTLDWVVKQPWFGGSIVLFGMSYLGYVQWAVADALPPEVKAMIPVVTESALTLEFLREDGFSLETPFEWGAMVNTQERRFSLLRMPFQAKKTARALHTVPLGQADTRAIGKRADYIQDILTHNRESVRWDGFDHRKRVADVTVPVSSVAGWFDIFLPGQLRDFQILQEAGRSARLTIGPWVHAQQSKEPFDEVLGFGLAYARGEEPPPRAPVRMYVMGEDAWRDVDSWPPPGYSPRRYHLHPGGTLATEPPAESDADRYRYDPADPTPVVGGASRIQKGKGSVDNSKLESRADVLTYTTPALEADLEVIGEVSAEIWFGSTVPYADVFVRLCDVDPSGRSFNICDGLVSLTHADEPGCATVTLWPTAYRFKRGHRVRVQVSSGAFPRYARNTGTGEPHSTATTFQVADQSVYHDPARPSAIILPVRT